jgi:hypothetical protein
MATFATVQECFERVYSNLREVNGENAPKSYTWFAPTPAELAEEVGDLLPEEIADQCEDSDGHPDCDASVGEAGSETIAWVYECNGHTLTRITASATGEEIEGLFEETTGLAEAR